MPNSIFILFRLVQTQRDIDHAQYLINLGRAINPDQHFQLIMDRQQTDLDVKQADLDQAFLKYSSLN
jgi:hypothetical protein